MSQYEWVEMVERYVQKEFGVISLKVRKVPEYYRSERYNYEYELVMQYTVGIYYSSGIKGNLSFEEEMYQFLGWVLKQKR